MFNIIHNDAVIKVDFIVRKDEDYRIVEFSRKKKVVVEGMPIWVASPEDLILSKLVWSKASESELQLRDVRYMLRTATDIDNEYLRKWAKKLGVESLLSTAAHHE
jgi:predicted nucleotidyltransferase